MPFGQQEPLPSLLQEPSLPLVPSSLQVPSLPLVREMLFGQQEPPPSLPVRVRLSLQQGLATPFWQVLVLVRPF